MKLITDNRDQQTCKLPYTYQCSPRLVPCSVLQCTTIHTEPIATLFEESRSTFHIQNLHGNYL